MQKWSKSIKAAQQAIKDYESTNAKVLAKNELERKRIEAECAQRLERWNAGLVALEQDLDKAFRNRPSTEVL
jgi:hypothetical protein